MARKLATKTEAENVLRDHAAQRQELLTLLKRLPAEVDPALAAEAALSLIHGSIGASGCWNFGRSCQLLPVPVIRAVLERLHERARDIHCDERDSAVLITSLCCVDMDGKTLEDLWPRVLQVLLDLNTTYGWGSKQRKAKLAALAADATVVRALQSVAVACEDAALDVLAVLCREGSEASFDALMPHLQRAEDSGERLEWLRRLRTHAHPESAAIRSFLESIDARLASQSECSGAIDLADALGFGRPKVFWFDAFIGSTTLLMPNNVPLYQGHVSVDSRDPTWFRLHLSSLKKERAWTTFGGEDERDDLEVGRCDAVELPRWLARVGEAFDTTWTVSLRTSLRGKKRQDLEAWLLSG